MSGAIDADWAFARYEAVRARLPAMPSADVTPERVGDLGDLVDAYDAFVLDGFGVLNVGGTAVPGAVKRIAALRRAGKLVVVLTNAATLPSDAAVGKYRALGFDFCAEEIVSSRDVAIAAMADRLANTRWGVAAAGEASLRGLPGHPVALEEAASAYDEADAFVLISADEWDERRQALLTASLRKRPREVIVANPDIVAPREGGLTREPGEFAHRLADDTGLAPRFYGKPFTNAFDAVLARLGERAPRPERIAMVGDTLHTDVLGGAAAEWGTVLIEAHGLFKGRDVAPYIERSGIAPSYRARTT